MVSVPVGKLGRWAGFCHFCPLMQAYQGRGKVMAEFEVPTEEQHTVTVFYAQVTNNKYRTVVNIPLSGIATVFLFEQVPNRPLNFNWVGTFRGALVQSEFPSAGAAELTIDGDISGSGGFGWDGPATLKVIISKSGGVRVGQMSVRVEEGSPKAKLDISEPSPLTTGSVWVQ
jgi:hypothetical protein